MWSGICSNKEEQRDSEIYVRKGSKADEIIAKTKYKLVFSFSGCGNELERNELASAGSYMSLSEC